MKTAWVVLGILLVALALHVHGRLAWLRDIPRVPLEAVYSHLDTGDLLLFRWKHAGLQYDLASPFTHVGMVLDRDGTKLVLETHAAGDGKDLGVDRSGVNLYDLRRRVATYKGDTYILKARPGLVSDAAKAIPLANLNTYVSIPYYDEFAAHIGMYCLPKRVCNACFGRPARAGMFCSEFVGHVLRHMGALPREVDVQCLTPTSFVGLHAGGRPLFNGLYKLDVRGRGVRP